MVELNHKTYIYISKDSRKCGGMARLRDTGVPVATIVFHHEVAKDPLEAIVAAYEKNGVTREMIEEALQYYGENRDEIDANLAQLTSPPRGFRLERETGILYPE